MDVLWLLALGLLLGGWFALDGFSLGLGMLLPALGRDTAERRRVITAMAPFFLANEVWLVAFAGVLIAAFPAVEASLLTGFYPVVIALIVAWLARDASVWFRSRRPSSRWRRRWDGVLATASVAFAASAGVFLGNAAQGIPDPGARPNLLNPYAVACGATAVAVFALHGAAFVAVRTNGEPRERARRIARYLVLPVLGLLLIVVAGLAVIGADAPLPALLLGGAGLSAVVLAGLALRTGRDGRAFAATTVAAASLPLTVGAGVAAGLLGGAADPVTLARLAVIALPVVPLVLAAQAWLWWVFRHRVDESSVIFF